NLQAILCKLLGLPILKTKTLTDLKHIAQLSLIWMTLSGLHPHKQNYPKFFQLLSHFMTWLTSKLILLNLYLQPTIHHPTTILLSLTTIHFLSIHLAHLLNSLVAGLHSTTNTLNKLNLSSMNPNISLKLLAPSTDIL